MAKKRKRTAEQVSNSGVTDVSTTTIQIPKQKKSRSARKKAKQVVNMDPVNQQPAQLKQADDEGADASQELSNVFDSKLNFTQGECSNNQSRGKTREESQELESRPVLSFGRISILVVLWLKNIGIPHQRRNLMGNARRRLPATYTVWCTLTEHEKVTVQYEPAQLLGHLRKQQEDLSRRLAELNSPHHLGKMVRNWERIPGVIKVQRRLQIIGSQLQQHADKLDEEQKLILGWHEIADENLGPEVDATQGQTTQQEGSNHLEGSNASCQTKMGQRHSQNLQWDYNQHPTPATQAQPQIIQEASLALRAQSFSPTDFSRPSPSRSASSALLQTTLPYSEPAIIGIPFGSETGILAQEQRSSFHSLAVQNPEHDLALDNAGRKKSKKEKKSEKQKLEKQKATEELKQQKELKDVRKIHQKEPKGKKPEAEPSTRPQPDPAYLIQSEKLAFTSPSPQPLLVICDLNGTLIKRLTFSGTQLTRRLGLETFLAYLFSHHKVMIWTSARPENMQKTLKNLLTPQQQVDCVAAWGRDTLGLSKKQYYEKVQVYKRLETVFKSDKVQQTYPNAPSHNGGTWGMHNTLLIDDSVEKGATQPYNLISVDTMGAPTDNTLIELIGYLEQIKYCVDVRPFIKTNPFRTGENWERHISPRLQNYLNDAVRIQEDENQAISDLEEVEYAFESDQVSDAPNDVPVPTTQPAGNFVSFRPTAPVFNPMPNFPPSTLTGMNAIQNAWPRDE